MGLIEIWQELPEVRNLEFNYMGHSDRDETYSEVRKMPPFDIFCRDADFTWEGVRFTSKREWFGAPRNEHLLVFRQTIEPFANCDFELKTWMEEPSEESRWQLEKYLEQENNSCGFLLRNPEGRHLILCETSQITSFSIRVNETREKVTRKYAIKAFEEISSISVNIEEAVSKYEKAMPDFIEDFTSPEGIITKKRGIDSKILDINSQIEKINERR